MSVKVKDLFDLKLFESARLVAGKNGLENEIKRINFSDCPVLDDVVDMELVMAGDFYVNSLYIAKDDKEEMRKIFDLYINSSSAGVCIIDEFLDDIPDDIKRFCDEKSFPVIFIDTMVPYAEIVITITEMILLEQADTISEMRIDRLLDGDINSQEVAAIATRINGSFKKFYNCLYINVESIQADRFNYLRKELNSNYDFEALKYRNNILMILNFNKQVMLKTHIDYVENLVKKYTEDYIIGVSNSFTSKDEFNHCVKQSLSSYELSFVTEDRVVHYKDLNVYKVLYPMRNSRHLAEFYREIFMPLKEYDEYYNSDIVNTVEVYLENNGEYKKTAQMLHQHENTVRYRILKAKKLLNLENDHLKFIEQVSLALKMDKIMNMDKKSILSS
ncbi:Sugar diacid utilization regulator [Dethiosulfatibacter aminovorans DSM 17477]|uniref:Sugar diacid utilization regulator n=1 Tax=Dethiosulfatibacter aminovorans DSM 17477 TaxID=1121476 RepID=A0A1M6HR38_9FIRM|nr:PucR family transcriptional regulator [Dethiosulfatibacter aminovorans]SHJ24665.1 Sugar diacid utilization regulator [Dethiosulfatibacter aminovorans DSM 17477]